jgi:hypothetical protein
VGGCHFVCCVIGAVVGDAVRRVHGHAYIEGFGHLLLVVALPTMMVGLAKPKDKSVVIGIWGTFFGVGFALLALAVPMVVARAGPQIVYGLHGLMLAML